MEDKPMHVENTNIDATLDQLSGELQRGETLILEVDQNRLDQSDTIYDTLVMRGYDVRRAFKNGRNQIIVSKKQGCEY